MLDFAVCGLYSPHSSASKRYGGCLIWSEPPSQGLHDGDPCGSISNQLGSCSSSVLQSLALIAWESCSVECMEEVRYMIPEDTWSRSSFCSTCTCVFVARLGDSVFLKNNRDDGISNQVIVSIRLDQWARLLNDIVVSNGNFPSALLAVQYDSFSVLKRADGSVVVFDKPGRSIEYDADEWEAFVAGVLNGDFDGGGTPAVAAAVVSDGGF